MVEGTPLGAVWIVATGLVLLAGAVLLGVWTYLDADARGSDAAALWGLGVAAFGPVVLLYLVSRRRLGSRDRPVRGREATVGTLAVGILVASVLGTELSPPDPFTQLRYLTYALPVGLAVGYVLVAREGYARLRRRVTRQ